MELAKISYIVIVPWFNKGKDGASFFMESNATRSRVGGVGTGYI